MIKGVHASANKIIEEELASHLKRLEGEAHADCLVFFGPIQYGVDDAIRDAVEGIPDKSGRLLVVLETLGGFIEVAQRISETLRRHYKIVEFLIPNYAMSAGTVLVMSGDAIHMDYYSVLGPIDPQVEGPNKRFIPANGYLIQYERLVEKSRIGKITTAELQFLIEKFDPAELYRYEQEVELSVALLKEWLVKYKFKNWNVTATKKKKVTMLQKKRRAETIAKKLNDTERWHSHGRGISREILTADLQLEIEDFGKKPQVSSLVRQYYKLLHDYLAKCGTEVVIHTRNAYIPLR